MEYLCIKFLCQKHPSKKYMLDENTHLFHGNREEVSFMAGSKLMIDTCYFVSDAKNYKEATDFINKFKKLLVIYSFVFDDIYPIVGYESIKFSKLETIKAKSLETIEKELFNRGTEAAVYPIDFNGISKHNNIHSHFFERKSFRYFYEKYLNMNKEHLDLIDLYVFDPSREIFTKQFYRADYLKISMKYIIIEKILGPGKKESCKNIISKCSDCGRENIKHDVVGLNKLISSKLDEYVGNKSKSKKYLDFLNLAKKIRNTYFHVGLTDCAEYIDDYPIGKHIEYDIKKTRNYKNDKTALINLETQVSDIARFLLFDVLFDIKEYPELKMLKSFKIVGPGTFRIK